MQAHSHSLALVAACTFYGGIPLKSIKELYGGYPGHVDSFKQQYTDRSVLEQVKGEEEEENTLEVRETKVKGKR